MFTGYLEQAQFPDSSFDAITLIEIVEHLRDAKALLAECARILKPGGIVLVTTPNAHSWTARAMGARWAGFSLNDTDVGQALALPVAGGVVAHLDGVDYWRRNLTPVGV